MLSFWYYIPYHDTTYYMHLAKLAYCTIPVHKAQETCLKVGGGGVINNYLSVSARALFIMFAAQKWEIIAP